MSDPEPLGKRMLGQLRAYEGPYRPDAWDHFEQFREKKRRQKRILLYWLSAAALIIIFGAALLTNQVTSPGKATRPPIAQKQTGNRRHPTQAKPVRSDNRDTLNHPETRTARKQIVRKNETTREQRHQFSRIVKSVANADDYPAKNNAGANDADLAHDDPSLQELQSQPFSSLVAGLGKLHIALPDQSIDLPPRPTRPIRWGAGVSQQSNRAAHTDAEANYGIGGTLLVPLSDRIALVTGFSAGKQSLKVKRQEELTASQGFPQLQGVHYHWVNLEAPVHLQYNLKRFRKLGLTAVGGISLQSSVGQEADYLYKTRRTINTFAETQSGPVLVSSQTVEELSSVTKNDKKDKWALGSALYLGIGLSYRWHNTALEVEPYFKYPVGALTADRLQMTSTGIQLRLAGWLVNKKPTARAGR